MSENRCVSETGPQGPISRLLVTVDPLVGRRDVFYIKVYRGRAEIARYTVHDIASYLRFRIFLHLNGCSPVVRREPLSEWSVDGGVLVVKHHYYVSFYFDVLR
jgi:hypothetical protein